VHVVSYLHLLIDVISEVNVIGEHVLPLGDIHSPQFRDVLLKFIDRLRSILLFDDVLNLAALLTECSFESVEVLVADLFKDFIFIS
jgi:hypothetical protein